MTLHKLVRWREGNDVPIVQIKQSKNQPSQIYLAIAVATAMFAFTWFADSWTGFVEASEKALGMKSRR